jgi:shikimate kinase
MGSGKTTQGNRISNRLNIDFFDLDQEIESRYRLSVFDFFLKYGEDAFRKIESNVLRSLSENENYVISTGGGTPCFNNNMEWMNRTGITFYIKMQEGVLINRLAASKTKRPLLMGKTDEEVALFVKNQLAEREYYYKQAHYELDGMSFDADMVPAIIENHYTSYMSL